MCILFIYVNKEDEDSDYRLILVSNRDEFVDRPAKDIAPWLEDPNVIGGRDKGDSEGGTWLAISPLRKKIGVLLNLPRTPKPDAISRGKIVADYVKSDTQSNEYIKSLRMNKDKFNNYIFIAIEIPGSSEVLIQSYSNESDEINKWTGPCIGFGNSLPSTPLKKVEGGIVKLSDICTKLNKVQHKDKLVTELIEFLKCDERYLPDKELETRRPKIYKQLSSIFVNIPEARYGTRTHTILLVTKSGQADLIEVSLQPLVDLVNPKWITTQLELCF